jgi:hypothetical protein
MKLIRRLIVLSLLFTSTLLVTTDLAAKKHIDETYQDYEEDTDNQTDQPVGLKALPHNYKEVLDLLSSSKDKAATTWYSLKDTYHSLKDKWDSFKKIIGWPRASQDAASLPKENGAAA